MTVAGINPQAHNAKPAPVGAGAGLYLNQAAAWAYANAREWPGLRPSFSHRPWLRAREACAMAYLRSRPEGRVHRTKIRVVLVPQLWEGCQVPSSGWLGWWLRIEAVP